MISRHHHNKHRFSLSLLLLVIISSYTSIAKALNYTTIQDGNWSSAATWSGGLIPDAYFSGDIVNIQYDAGSDLFIENGTLNVYGILDIPNHNVKMENSSGVVNINSGLIILGNDNSENKVRTDNFSSGAMQMCNGSFTNENA